jgi:hypothetical protein
MVEPVASEIESSPEEVDRVALLVLQPQQDQGLLVQQVRMAPGMEQLEKAEVAERVVSVHILGSPPMLLLREDEALSILRTLQSTDQDPVLLPTRVTLALPTSVLAAPVELAQLR